MTENQNEQGRQRPREQKMSSLRPVSWSRVYRDWRFLAAFFLIAVAVVSYLVTGDLSWRPFGRWHQTVEKSDKTGTDLPPVTANP